MATENTLSQQLLDLLATRNLHPEMLDRSGKPTDAPEAKTFTFDYEGASGKNYGTMVIVLDSDNEMKIMYGDNLGRTMEGTDKNEFFDFIQHLSKKATMNRWTHTIADISQLKHTMQGLAAIQEGLFEGYYGNRNISYAGAPTQARLKIKHSQPLGENDARFRHVESLFVETADGECFRLGFRNLSGGRAMLEHVRQGGKPYDIRGCHLTEMVMEIATLARFNRASAGRVLEGVTQEVVSQAQVYYKQLRENLKRMSTSRGYSKYFESWHPADITEQEELVENIKTLFVEQTIDTRIEQALPLLAKIQQGLDMKEAKIFESWIDNLAEGTWNLPETPEQLDKLKTMMASELIVGPDAINATEQLYDLVGDDILFDRLSELAAKDPRANAWNDTEVMNRLAKLGIEMPEPSVPGNPAEPATAPVTEGPAVDAYMSGKSPALAHFADQLDKSTEQAVSESAELNTMLKYAGIPLTEGVLDDVRARMDARRNPAAATPATAQPVQSPTTQVPKFKVGDTVSFGIGRGVPSTGTITAMGPGPTQLTVKTAEGENQLDTRMKSLYLQLATATTSAESQQSTPDLPRAEVVSTMGMPSRSLIGYKDNTYTPSGPYTKAPEGATGTQVLVPAAAFGIRSMGDVVALLTDDGTAYAEQPIKVSNPFGRSAAPTAQLSQGLDEADEWEEETGKFQRFLEYVKKTLMRERDPKRRIETANYLSKQENKFFGSPISSASEQTPFGSVNTGKAFTDIIKGIMDDIQSGNLHYEQQAVQAAIWLEPEGKQFLKKAHNDFIQMIDHSSKEREQHAIALSGYQIQNLGGRVIGDPLKGGVTNNPVARMTPEIYGVFELAEAELRRMKGEREDEEERQQTVAMWNALPMPLKLAAAAAVGKTPAQLEKILLAKNEIEAVGGLDVSDFPNLPQQADADEFEKPEDETPNNSTDKKDKPVAEGQGATTYTVAYKDPTKPGKSHSTQVKATSAAEAKAAFQEWDTTNRFTYLGSRPDVDTVREGVAEAAELNTMLKYAGIPVKESVLTDSTGSTLEHIKNTFRRDVKDFTQTGNMSDPLYDALYDYYFDDMPYGTKKARDGDPYEWISNRFSDDIGLDEGWKGAIAGGLAGGALGSVVPALGTLAGAAAGAYAGHKLGDQGFKDPDAEYKKAQKLKQQPSVDEADAISTFEVMSGFDAPVAEGSCNMTSEGAYCPEHGLAECAMEEEKDITTPGEKILGATTGAAIGALAGNYIGDRSSIGTLGGLALGGIAGNKIATTAGNKNVGNKINQDSNWGVGEQQPAEGWKGELAGGTAGGIAGTLAGTALGGPVGGLIGGAAGGTGGAMIGRKLTKETGSYYESREGDAMLARIKSLALLK